MARGGDSEIVRKSVHPLGSQRDEILEESKSFRLFAGRCTLWFGFVIFLFIVSTVTVIILELTHSPKTLRTTKAKRFVETIQPNAIYPQIPDNDNEIIPQNENNRENQHRNHRYVAMEPQDKIYKKIMRNLYEESGWSPKPFEIRSLSGTREATSKNERPGGDFETGKERVKGLKSSMRLKGVYIQPENDEDGFVDKNNANGDDDHYPKEINYLMENDYERDTKGGNWSLKKVFRGQGSPFQLPPKGRSGLKRHHTKHPKPNGYPKRLNKKPITILLGIYPMTDNSDYPRNNPMFGESTNVLRYLLPHGRKKEMIMKLNLYPKEWRRPNMGRHRMKERRATTEEECTAIGLQPHGKAIRAKWKVESGKWFHAKRANVHGLMNEGGWKVKL